MLHTTHDRGSLDHRSSQFIATDTRVVQWIAQQAVNVELFTIPLYMTALYSLTGMHPITGKGNALYKGRQWPGAKTSVIDRDPDRSVPGWGNKRAFNIIFSVFIQEMLHLQMAGNLATAIGHNPDFTSTALQNAKHGWTCYGENLSVIPAIVDLKDTASFADVAVNVGPVDTNSVKLFLAIETPQELAEKEIIRNLDKYFPKVPFDHGAMDFDPATAGIMFGSIGYMYQCYRDYLLIKYDDGTRLWDHVFNADGQQNDMFNNFSFPGHPMREFPGFETTLALTDREIALQQALNMMNAITDQGEGATLKARLRSANDFLLKGPVEARYRSSEDALVSDYPSYSESGEQLPSADAAARYRNDGVDHFERFQEVESLLDQGGIECWTQSAKVGNWTAQDLVTSDYDPDQNPYDLPAPDQIANALNELAAPDVAEANFNLLSSAVVGAIKGVTTVLDSYWNPTGGTVSFPFPSMVGSGDRMSACWAIFGKAPDLSQGISAPNYKVLNHACQGLDLDGPDAGKATNHCADIAIFHTCRGSNLCKGMGGCGFVQSYSGGGGGSCSSSGGCGASTVKTAAKGGGCSAVSLRVHGGLCGGPKPTPTPSGATFSAPSDNTCQGFGGCAVPISACQVYPTAGIMDVYDFGTAAGEKSKSEKIGTIKFAIGDKVEDIAFQAFSMVVKKQNPDGALPQKPAPDALRLAFPPST